MIKFFIFCLCFLPLRVAVGQVTEQKIIASDTGPGDFFGRYLALSENFLFVGAHQDDVNGYASGSLYIFEKKNPMEGFKETQKIVPEDGDIEEFFSYSIAIENEWAVTGSHHDSDFGGSSGSAYILKNIDQGSWEIVQKLLPTDPKAGDEFAKAVDMQNNYLFAGAFLDDDMGSNTGSVYVFKLQGNEWVEVQEIHAQDAAAYDQFGNFLSTNGEELVVGVPEKKTNEEKSGAAYVFKDVGNEWIQTQKITPADLMPGDQFGQALSIKNDFLAIGAYKSDSNTEDGGAVYLYQKEAGKWNFSQKIIPEDNESGDHFGNAVALGEGILAIGAYFDDDLGSKSGSIYLYKEVFGYYHFLTKITASDGSAGDAFGSSIAIDGAKIVTGAYADSDHGFFAGSVYVLEVGDLIETKDETINEPILIYPTICQSMLTIKFPSGYSEPKTLTLFDNQGRKTFQKTLKLPSESIYLDMLEAGIYHILLEEDGAKLHSMIIKKE